MDWLRGRLQSLADAAVAALVISPVVGLLLGAWAVLSHLPRAWVPFVFLGGFAFSLEIVAQTPMVWQRIHRPRTPKQWGEAIERWTLEYGYSITRLPEPAASFCIRATKRGQSVTVLIAKDNPSLLRLQVGVGPPKGTEQQYAALEGDDLARVDNHIEFDLLRYGVEVLQWSKTGIILQDTVLCDENLNQHQLLQRMLYMIRATNFTLLSWAEALGVPMQPDA